MTKYVLFKSGVEVKFRVSDNFECSSCVVKPGEVQEAVVESIINPGDASEKGKETPGTGEPHPSTSTDASWTTPDTVQRKQREKKIRDLHQWFSNELAILNRNILEPENFYDMMYKLISASMRIFMTSEEEKLSLLGRGPIPHDTPDIQEDEQVNDDEQKQQKIVMEHLDQELMEQFVDKPSLEAEVSAAAKTRRNVLTPYTSSRLEYLSSGSESDLPIKTGKKRAQQVFGETSSESDGSSSGSDGSSSESDENSSESDAEANAGFFDDAADEGSATDSEPSGSSSSEGMS